MQEESSGLLISGWQCLLCGDVQDPVIEANRNGHLEPTASRARPPGTVPGRSGRSTARGPRSSS